MNAYHSLILDPQKAPGDTINTIAWTRLAEVTAHVRSLEYHSMAEPINRMVPANLALGARQYLPSHHRCLLPNVQRIIWSVSETRYLIGPSHQATWGLLLLFLGSELHSLKDLQLIGHLENPAPFLSALRPHVPTSLTSLSILCTQPPDHTFVSALSNLLDQEVLPSLRSLRISSHSYDFSTMEGRDFRQIKRVHLRFTTSAPAQTPFSFLSIRRVFAGTNRLCLESAEPVQWRPQYLTELLAEGDLEELQFFAPAPPDRALIIAESMFSMANVWANISTLNLANVCASSPAILDDISIAMPRMAYLALFFSSWVCGAAKDRMRELKVLAFNLADIPPRAMMELGFYIGFLCPRGLKLAAYIPGLTTGYEQMFNQIVALGAQGLEGELVRMLAVIDMTLSAGSRQKRVIESE